MDPRAHRPTRGGMLRGSGFLRSFRLSSGIALAAVVGLLACGCEGSASPSSQSQAGSSATGGPRAWGIVTPMGVHTVSPARESMGEGNRSGVRGGALFGGDIQLAREEAKLGRRLAIFRDYYHFGQTFPTSVDRRLMAAGSTLVVSLATVPPGGPSYASIAAGREDGYITTFLRSVEQAAITYKLGAIYICFEHEADTLPHHAGLGSPSEFIRAWDHIHQLAVNMHLDWNQGGRLHWVFILTVGAFIHGIASSFWPGSNEVDIVAADGYNTAYCRLYRPGNLVASGTREVTPAHLFGPVIGFAHAAGGLPVFITEWGTVPYTSPTVQPGFIHQMQSYVTDNHEIAAALYWNNHGHHNACDYSLDNRPGALAALAEMGHASALQGQVPFG